MRAAQWLGAWSLLLAMYPLGAPAQDKSEKDAKPAAVQQPKARPRLPKGTKALRDLEYVKGGHERNKLDLYLPEKADGPLPVIVWIHGGAWSGGSKDIPGQALAFVG